MTKEQLQQSLTALKNELAKLQDGDPTVRERVDELITDVEAQLADPENDAEPETISERISHFIEQMEIEHPITETLNRFLTTLGEMGI